MEERRIIVAGLPAEALVSGVGYKDSPPSLIRAMARSLRQNSGLPAEALAKAGGGGGSRTYILSSK